MNLFMIIEKLEYILLTSLYHNPVIRRNYLWFLEINQCLENPANGGS